MFRVNVGNLDRLLLKERDDYRGRSDIERLELGQFMESNPNIMIVTDEENFFKKIVKVVLYRTCPDCFIARVYGYNTVAEARAVMKKYGISPLCSTSTSCTACWENVRNTELLKDMFKDRNVIINSNDTVFIKKGDK